MLLSLPTDRVTLLTKAADTANATTTLANDPDLQFPGFAGDVYVCQLNLFFSFGAASTGVRIGVNAPAGTQLMLSGWTTFSNTTYQGGNTTSLNSPILLSSSDTDTNAMVTAWFFVKLAQDGQVNLKFAAAAASTTATLTNRSSMQVWKV